MKYIILLLSFLALNTFQSYGQINATQNSNKNPTKTTKYRKVIKQEQGSFTYNPCGEKGTYTFLVKIDSNGTVIEIILKDVIGKHSKCLEKTSTITIHGSKFEPSSKTTEQIMTMKFEIH
tara:strand:+ start:1243 stop:1602 length:360 start_codon:yes stop_codon:yes gene_type:complete